jgi:RNA polymerase sigma-70 factor (ECF subfamily)
MKTGGQDASKVDLEKAVHDYYKGVYRFALYLSKSPDDAADLTQFAYERLTRKHADITDPSKVKAWLNSTVYRKFLDQKRRLTRFPETEFNEELGGHEAPATDGGDRVDAAAAVDALNELEDDLRAPLALFYLESYPYKKIAAILDLPIGTVMSRLYRGKLKLYQHLTGEPS